LNGEGEKKGVEGEGKKRRRERQPPRVFLLLGRSMNPLPRRPGKKSGLHFYDYERNRQVREEGGPSFRPSRRKRKSIPAPERGVNSLTKKRQRKKKKEKEKTGCARREKKRPTVAAENKRVHPDRQRG